MNRYRTKNRCSQWKNIDISLSLKHTFCFSLIYLHKQSTKLTILCMSLLLKESSWNRTWDRITRVLPLMDICQTVVIFNKTLYILNMFLSCPFCSSSSNPFSPFLGLTLFTPIGQLPCWPNLLHPTSNPFFTSPVIPRLEKLPVIYQSYRNLQ